MYVPHKLIDILTLWIFMDIMDTCLGQWFWKFRQNCCWCCLYSFPKSNMVTWKAGCGYGCLDGSRFGQAASQTSPPSPQGVDVFVSSAHNPEEIQGSHERRTSGRVLTNMRHLCGVCKYIWQRIFSHRRWICHEWHLCKIILVSDRVAEVSKKGHIIFMEIWKFRYQVPAPGTWH